MPTLVTVPKTAPDFGRIRQAIAHRYQKPKSYDDDGYHDQYRAVLLAEHDGERVLVALDGRRAARAVVDSPALLDAPEGLYDVKSDTARAVELVPSLESAGVWPQWDMLFSRPYDDVPCVPVACRWELVYACAAFSVLVDPELPIVTEGVAFIPAPLTPPEDGTGALNSVQVLAEGITGIFMPLRFDDFKRGVERQAREYFDAIRRQQEKAEEKERIAGV